MMKTPLLLIASLLLGHASAMAAPKNICGDLVNAYGPFDYRRANTDFADSIRLVEHAHFTPEVEAGIKGNSGTVGADLDYTLRAFPNHTRALSAMGRLGILQKTLRLPGANYPVECYYDRAIRFAPDDGTVRATYGSYLFSRGQSEQAMKMFTQAVELEPENASINYNAGLAYVKAKDYVLANKYAQKAYSMGFPLPGLKNQLVSAGKWDESVRPAPPPSEAPAVAAPAAPATPDPVKPPPPHE
jgi:tetratricopeptide (TPR) repeat protein